MGLMQNWDNSDLADYLLYDYWEPFNAWRVLSGFNYYDQSEWNGGRELNGNSLLDHLTEWKDIDLGSMDFADMYEMVRRLGNFWLASGLDDTKYSPSFFIEWALSKRIKPDWFDWAIENKLYIPKQGEETKIETPQQRIEADKQAGTGEAVESNTQSEPQSVQANAKMESEIYDLFDAMSQAAIAVMFEKVTQDEWKSYFERAARNGLGEARQGDASPCQYNPAKVADWLVSKGLYARDYAGRRLANCIPIRNRDYKYLITGVIE